MNLNELKRSSIICRYLAENPPRKKLLIFWEMEVSCSNIKKFLIFFYISGNVNPPPPPKKKVLYFLKNRNTKKLLILREMELLAQSSKN